jgi:hypothetical protein
MHGVLHGSEVDQHDTILNIQVPAFLIVLTGYGLKKKKKKNQ